MNQCLGAMLVDLNTLLYIFELVEFQYIHQNIESSELS